MWRLVEALCSLCDNCCVYGSPVVQSHKGVDAVLAVAAAEGDGCVSLLGRRLKVDKAVDRAHAPVPIAATSGTGRGSSGKVDRRYLYLANEGLILPDQSTGGLQVCSIGYIYVAWMFSKVTGSTA